MFLGGISWWRSDNGVYTGWDEADVLAEYLGLELTKRKAED